MRRVGLFVVPIAAFVIRCDQPDGPASPDVIVGDYEYETEILPFLDLIFGDRKTGAAGQDAIARWGVAELEPAGDVSGEDIATIESVIQDINCSAGREIIRIVDANGVLDFYYVPSAEIDGGAGYAHISWDASHRIARGRIVIAEELDTGVKRQNTIRHEMLHAIGLLGHPQRNDSVLSSGLPITHFTELDRTLIKMLYHPDIHVGMNRDQVFSVLRSAERIDAPCEGS